MSTKYLQECRLCGAEKSAQTLRAETVYGGGPEHAFFECSRCGAIYLSPALDEDDEARFYRQEFEKFMESRSGQDRDWSSAEAHVQTNQDNVIRRWQVLEPYVDKGLDVLEIGCSSGFMLDAFRDAGLLCAGIEPSGTFVDYLRKKNHEIYESLDAMQVKTPFRRFDLIVHFFLFEHISDPWAFMQETYSLLKPGGRIIAEIPSATDPLTSMYNIPEFEKFYWSIAHHFYYRPQSIRFLMDRLGYEYELIPEQRYDLSNHIVWMTEGRPGGQGRFSEVFSTALLEVYKEDLKKSWLCDTMFLIVHSND